MLFRSDIAIDLGTSNILVYVKGKGIVLNEPAVVAIDQHTNNFLAVGQEASNMLGRTPGNIVAIKPLKDGVISNFDITYRMIKYFIQKSLRGFIFRPRVLICVPSEVTDVERRAIIQASNQAGASRTALIEEPIAAAIGVGVDIASPEGKMIVDIGGGTTDIALIALGGLVVNKSIKMAGDNFDQVINKYIRDEHNLMIGEHTCIDLKHNLATVCKPEQIKAIHIKGRDLDNGLPVNLLITNKDMYKALQEASMVIVDAIKKVLEETPAELASDIADKGIVLTGGGSLMEGMDQLISSQTGVPVRIAHNPIDSVVRGTGKSLKWIRTLLKGENDFYRG